MEYLKIDPVPAIPHLIQQGLLILSVNGAAGFLPIPPNKGFNIPLLKIEPKIPPFQDALEHGIMPAYTLQGILQQQRIHRLL